MIMKETNKIEEKGETEERMTVGKKKRKKAKWKEKYTITYTEREKSNR